jgi:RNA polymerase sigma-70 factor (ECF subfamily)
MKLPRRRFLHLAGAAAVVPAVSRVARAQSYPTRPIDLEAAVLACAAGDESGLRDIYEREAARLLAVAYRIVGRRDLAEDVIQDAFVQIWQHARTFDPGRGSAQGWIHSVVRSCASRLQRARLLGYTIDDQILLAIFDVFDSNSTPRLPEGCDLRRQLAKLDPEKRASVIRAYVDVV